MVVFETEISSAVGEYMTYLHSEDENIVGYVQPEWWTAPDLTHSEFTINDSEKVLTIHRISPWRELELSWTDDVASDETGNIVVFADFKKSDDTK
jgi:hypothetical protein